jgi:hypothetical protein
VVWAVAGVCAGLACVSAARAQSATPAPDAAAKLTLFAAAFANSDVPSMPRSLTAMAFLPGRGVVSWDVAGKTQAEAQEAQVEAMGLADARAVQREIDAANARRQTQQEADETRRNAFADEAGAQRIALNVPAITGSDREAGSIVPLNRAARGGAGLGLRSSETLRGRARMYAFAAVSGRTVGLNVLHDDAGWRNGGVTSDRNGATGQRQAGLAWRKGAVQTALSYVQQKDHTQILGMQTDKDHRLMLTMNLQPQAIAGLFRRAP